MEGRAGAYYLAKATTDNKANIILEVFMFIPRFYPECGPTVWGWPFKQIQLTLNTCGESNLDGKKMDKDNLKFYALCLSEQ